MFFFEQNCTANGGCMILTDTSDYPEIYSKSKMVSVLQGSGVLWGVIVIVIIIIIIIIIIRCTVHKYQNKNIRYFLTAHNAYINIHNKKSTIIFLFGPTAPPPQWVRAHSITRFLDHTQRRTIVGRTPLDEWSARRRDLYLITHEAHNRQTSMPPVGFVATIAGGERPQTYALDRTATGIGHDLYIYIFIY